MTLSTNGRRACCRTGRARCSHSRSRARSSRPTHSSRRLRLVTHATSLGGVESLIERRARYAGDASVAGPTLCRLSVGIENVEDLWADLDGALRAAFA